MTYAILLNFATSVISFALALGALLTLLSKRDVLNAGFRGIIAALMAFSLLSGVYSFFMLGGMRAAFLFSAIFLVMDVVMLIAALKASRQMLVAGSAVLAVLAVVVVVRSIPFLLGSYGSSLIVTLQKLQILGGSLMRIALFGTTAYFGQMVKAPAAAAAVAAATVPMGRTPGALPFCPNCGAQLNPTTPYCGRCGTWSRPA